MNIELEAALDGLFQRGFCWSLGRTRIAKYECRIWTDSQDDNFPRIVIIEDGKSFRESVENALFRLGNRNLYLEKDRKSC